MRRASRLSCALSLLGSCVLGVSCTDGSTELAGRGVAGPEELAAAAQARTERKTAMAARVEELRADPAGLSALLGDMPKGADLHSHLSGTVATRDLIAWGKEAGLCLQPADYTLVTQDPCPDGTVSLATLGDDAPLHEELVRAWSMEGQTPGPFDDAERRSALAERHAHFFDAFLKFYPITKDSTAQMIAEVRRASARQHVGHVELQVAFGTSAAGRSAATIFAQDPAWTGAWNATTPLAAWTAKQTRIRSKIAGRLAPQVAELEDWEAEAAALLACDATDGTRDPGCDVDVRYLVQVNRTQTREHVFGQLVYAMELARSDDAGADRIAGVNLALAEENEASLRAYEDDMFSIAVLRQIAAAQHPDEPAPQVALHAGEMVPELLAEDGSADRHLTFHIRAAAAVADRIGHGVDIEREDPDGSLRADMAARGVLVEACLTSNDWLLDVRGAEHPLRSYFDAGVPVALATDDAGVFGTTLSAELQRAVELHGLGYAALEQMARASLEHSFLAGPSLSDGDACADALALEKLAPEELDPDCSARLEESPRARATMEFERALLAFERAHAAPPEEPGAH